MKIVEIENGIMLKEVEDFSLEGTFDCGQCFRFNKIEDNTYIGVAFSKVVKFKAVNKDIIIENINIEEFHKDWYRFLDLDRDYSSIKAHLSQDKTMKKAIEYGNGIRILRQDFFECVLSFIISQQNNIPKIKKAVEGFCETFGEKILFEGKEYFTFPSEKDVCYLNKEDLSHLKLGYRDQYLIDAIKTMNSGECSFDQLNELPYQDAKEQLLKIKGIGNKVADCILLFSLGKFEAFPVDTWIKKAMLSLYDLKECEIKDYSALHYGSYSGFAQQYIFYYMRSLKTS